MPFWKKKATVVSEEVPQEPKPQLNMQDGKLVRTSPPQTTQTIMQKMRGRGRPPKVQQPIQQPQPPQQQIPQEFEDEEIQQETEEQMEVYDDEEPMETEQQIPQQQFQQQPQYQQQRPQQPQYQPRPQYQPQPSPQYQQQPQQNQFIPHPEWSPPEMPPQPKLISLRIKVASGEVFPLNNADEGVLDVINKAMLGETTLKLGNAIINGKQITVIELFQ